MEVLKIWEYTRLQVVKQPCQVVLVGKNYLAVVIHLLEPSNYMLLRRCKLVLLLKEYETVCRLWFCTGHRGWYDSYGTTAGNLSNIELRYNNSGYQIQARVSWSSGSTPVVNWSAEGLTHRVGLYNHLDFQIARVTALEG